MSKQLQKEHIAHTSAEGRPTSVPLKPICLTISIPFVTLPKTTVKQC